MNPHETFDALFAAAVKWRDELAPEASVQVTLQKWQHNHAPGKTVTRLRVSAVTFDGVVAQAETEDDNVASTLVRLTEAKANCERIARAVAEATTPAGAPAEEGEPE